MAQWKRRGRAAPRAVRLADPSLDRAPHRKSADAGGSGCREGSETRAPRAVVRTVPGDTGREYEIPANGSVNFSGIPLRTVGRSLSERGGHGHFESLYRAYRFSDQRSVS